jgi:hypothetical protein
MRIPAAFLEWYLSSQRATKAILIAHVFGLYFGAFAAFADSPPTGQSDVPPGYDLMSSPAFAIFGVYFLTATMSLGIAALVTLVRQLSRHGRPRAVIHSSEPYSLRSVLKWNDSLRLNTVLIAATSLIIAPSFAEQEGQSFVYGVFGGVLVSLLLRLPGAWAEAYLTRRRLQRAIYWTHIAAGLMSALVAVANYADPDAGVSPLDAVVIVVSVYLFLSSMFVGTFAVLHRLVKAVVTPRRTVQSPPTATTGHPTQVEGKEAATPPRYLPREQVSPASPNDSYRTSDVESWKESAIGQDANYYLGQAVGQERGSENHPDVEREVQTPTDRSNFDHPIGLARNARDRSANEPTGDKPAGTQTKLVRNQVGLVLGIVVGLASLVQGFDPTDPFRTSIGAIAVGIVGLAVIFLLTRRHDGDGR